MIVIDLTQLTTLERRAAQAELEAMHPDEAARPTLEEFLTRELSATLKGYVERFIQASMPGLRQRAIRFLDLDGDKQAEVDALIGYTAPEPGAPAEQSAPGGEHII